MLRILLIRHGETDWNRDRRIMGMQDIPLNETGKQQSLRMKESLSRIPIDVVFSSPVLRAKETAQILCDERDLTPVYDSNLQEIDYGDWVGMTFKEVRELPGYIPYYERLVEPVAPKGETLYQVRDRVFSFLTGLQKELQDRTIVVVSHADTIKCLLMHLLEIPFKNIWKFRIDNVSVSLLECEDERRRVICVNQRGDFDRLFVSRFSF